MAPLDVAVTITHHGSHTFHALSLDAHQLLLLALQHSLARPSKYGPGKTHTPTNHFSPQFLRVHNLWLFGLRLWFRRG